MYKHLLSEYVNAKQQEARLADLLRELKSEYSEAKKRLEKSAQRIIDEMSEDGCVYDPDTGLRLKKCPARVEVYNIDAVPDEFVRIKKEVDKKAVKEFLKENSANWGQLVQDKWTLTHNE